MFGRKDTKQGLPISSTDVEVTELETTEEKAVDTAQREENGVALLRREDMQRSSAASGNVASADISGDVNAKVTTAGALELRSTAKVVGELTVQALVIERGAHFEGQVKMTS